jgi:hypothetical protein
MLGESDLIDEIGELVEGSDRAISVLCRKCPSGPSNGRDGSLHWSRGSVVESREGVAWDGLSWSKAGSSSIC